VKLNVGKGKRYFFADASMIAVLNLREKNLIVVLVGSRLFYEKGNWNKGEPSSKLKKEKN